MISYVIIKPNPVSSKNYMNMISKFDFCNNIDELNNIIIKEITSFMHNFFYRGHDFYYRGHNKDILSYDDFCIKWWQEQNYEIIDVPLFYIKYFENRKWNEWKTDDHKNEIYKKYCLY